jgi:hypothetical protein
MRMNTNMSRLKLAACMAWSGLAISSASSVHALAATTQAEPYSYGTCSPVYYAQLNPACAYNFNYIQRIRFLNIGCNSGSCYDDNFQPLVEYPYGSGRKTAAFLKSCSPWTVYGVSSCGC